MSRDLIHQAWARSDFSQLLSIRRSLKNKDLQGLHFVELLFLGMAAATQEKYKLALPCFWYAFEKAPDNADVRLNLGNCLKDVGDFQGALEVYSGAKEKDDDLLIQVGIAICNLELGNNLKALEQLTDIDKNFPGDFRAKYHYGRVLFRFERIEEAISCYKAALTINPQFGPAATNLAIAFFKNRDLNSGYALAEQVVQAEQYDESFLISLITTSLEAGAPDIGLAFFKKNSKKFSPHLDFVAAEAARYMRDSAQAVKLTKRVLARDQGHLAASVVCIQSLSDLGRSDEAKRVKDQKYSRINFRGLDAKLLPNPWALFAIEENAQKIKELAEFYAASTYNKLPRERVHVSSSRGERVVGFYSPDFAEHPVAECMLPVFQQDWERVCPVAFSTRAVHDKMSEKIRESVSEFVECRNHHITDLRRLVKEREINIMVDMAVYTNGGRPVNFALGIAELQVNFLGYSGTSGAAAYDYIVGDSFITPDRFSKFYSEKIANLDVPLLSCSLRATSHLSPPNREVYSIPQGVTVFGCLAQYYKINSEVLSCWVQILKGVRDSVLLLSHAEESTKRAVRKFFQDNGVVGERILFARREPSRDEHLARLKLVDVFLDSFPYNAHSLAADAISAGVPLVTFAQESFASRVAGSLLQGLGLSCCIASTRSEYVDIAIRLGTDSTQRGQIASHVEDQVLNGKWASRYAKSLSSMLFHLSP